MIKRDKKIILTFVLVSAIFSFNFIFTIPVLAQVDKNVAGSKLDYSGLVDCDGVVDDKNPLESERKNTCNFAALMRTVVKLINWAFYIAIPFAVVMFAWAGLLYMTGSEAKIKKAKDIFLSVGIGFIIMLVAWLGVRTVVDMLVREGSGATSLIEK